MRLGALASLVFISLEFGGFGGAALAQTKVRVGNINTASDAGIYIAEAKGYFKAEGLDVEFITFKTAAQMIAPLGSGQLDVGGGTVSAGLYNAFSRKIGIRIVADKGSSRPGHVFSQVMARKDHVDSGRYKTFQDLKGMKIAIAGLGTGNGATLNAALKKGGLSFADVTTIDLGFPDHVAAYLNKAVDAGVTNEPSATLATQAGAAVKSPGNEELFENHQTAVLLYADDFAKKRPETALKFMRAYIRAARDYNDALGTGGISGKGADAVIATLLKYTDIKDPALLRAIVPPAFNPDGAVDIASLDSDLVFFKEMKLIEDAWIKAADVVDPAFAAKAAAELGAYRAEK